MTTVLVVAKAPVPGLAKTRLAAGVGAQAAAELAAAALLDTLASCAEAVGPRRCRLALAGDLDDAVCSAELRAALAGWTVVPQRDGSLAERLAHAHRGVAGPVLQIGMDTPQVTPTLLLETAALVDEDDAVVGPADDGGWWALGLRDPRAAAALTSVPMSTPQTYAATCSALEATGLRVAEGARLRDVDHLADVAPVAAAAPRSRFARAALAAVR